jgi:hypothetical protein
MIKVVQCKVEKPLPLPTERYHRWASQLGIETHEEPRIPNMHPYSHYACGVVSCCLVSASLAFLISLESSPASATPYGEAVFRECVALDLFQNMWH